MTLEEAILISKEAIVYLTLHHQKRLASGLILSIEALRWRLQIELDYGSWCGPPLPGETKT